MVERRQPRNTLEAPAPLAQSASITIASQQDKNEAVIWINGTNKMQPQQSPFPRQMVSSEFRGGNNESIGSKT